MKKIASLVRSFTIVSFKLRRFSITRHCGDGNAASIGKANWGLLQALEAARLGDVEYRIKSPDAAYAVTLEKDFNSITVQIISKITDKQKESVEKVVADYFAGVSLYRMTKGPKYTETVFNKKLGSLVVPITQVILLYTQK